MGKPSQKIIAKQRDAERGTKGTPVLAAWPNDFGGMNWRLEEGWKLVGPNGETVTTGRDGNAYLNGYVNAPEAAAGKQESPPDDDDIPF
jgi:hypothetical protein